MKLAKVSGLDVPIEVESKVYKPSKGLKPYSLSIQKEEKELRSKVYKPSKGLKLKGRFFVNGH